VAGVETTRRSVGHYCTPIFTASRNGGLEKRSFSKLTFQVNLQCCIEHRLPLISLDSRMCGIAESLRIKVVQ
jgi:hypothetical protein